MSNNTVFRQLTLACSLKTTVVTDKIFSKGQFPDNCKIPGHFQVFETSGHSE